mmetsp:Transcript_28815/g.49029  ORF Transcript_28815/g.49029 Transcript_28815/m.49029 type:complete len:160 (-) Transcript_28815:331-810(-)
MILHECTFHLHLYRILLAALSLYINRCSSDHFYPVPSTDSSVHFSTITVLLLDHVLTGATPRYYSYYDACRSFQSFTACSTNAALSIYPLLIAKSKALSPKLFFTVGSTLSFTNKALTHKTLFASSTPLRRKHAPINGVRFPSLTAFGSAPAVSSSGIK